MRHLLAHTEAAYHPDQESGLAQAGLRDTETILSGAARTLDFGQPVAVLLLAVLHFIPDSDDPYGIIGRLMAAMPSGSYLVVRHAASDIEPEAVAEHARRYKERVSGVITPRSREQVAQRIIGRSRRPAARCPPAGSRAGRYATAGGSAPTALR